MPKTTTTTTTKKMSLSMARQVEEKNGERKENEAEE
jgi:hypothetical protein